MLLLSLMIIKKMMNDETIIYLDTNLSERERLEYSIKMIEILNKEKENLDNRKKNIEIAHSLICLVMNIIMYNIYYKYDSSVKNLPNFIILYIIFSIVVLPIKIFDRQLDKYKNILIPFMVIIRFILTIYYIFMNLNRESFKSIIFIYYFLTSIIINFQLMIFISLFILTVFLQIIPMIAVKILSLLPERIKRFIYLFSENLLDNIQIPASKKDINNVLSFTFSEENSNNECPICLMNFEINDQCREINCKHTFHKVCIDDWFTRSCKCPICRYDIIRNSHKK